MTEQSINRSEEKLQTASRQDMTVEYPINNKQELLLPKVVDLSINNPGERNVANCILSHVGKDGNAISCYKQTNNGVIEWKY